MEKTSYRGVSLLVLVTQMGIIKWRRVRCVGLLAGMGER
jgi:hypothetical protein